MAATDQSDFIKQLNEVPDLNTVHAMQIMGGSEVLYENTIKYMIKYIPSTVEQMEQSLEHHDLLKDFAVTVHGIKSSLKQVGHLRLAKQAEALEFAAKAGDNTFCLTQFGSFREDLLRFYQQVSHIISMFEVPETSDANEYASITNEFYDILKKVNEEAEAFDAMAAAELLMPLAKRRFDEDTNQLIAKTMEALDSYKTSQALEYIAELLEKRNLPGTNIHEEVNHE